MTTYLPPPENFAPVLRCFTPVLKLMGHHGAVELFEAIAKELEAARAALGARPGESLAEAAKRAGVPRTHCNRCDRCGWTLAESKESGCVPGNCSQRPGVPLRTTCAGCGLPLVSP